MTFSGIISDFPELTTDVIKACLPYAADSSGGTADLVTRGLQPRARTCSSSQTRPVPIILLSPGPGPAPHPRPSQSPSSSSAGPGPAPHPRPGQSPSSSSAPPLPRTCFSLPDLPSHHPPQPHPCPPSHPPKPHPRSSKLPKILQLSIEIPHLSIYIT